MRIAVIPPSTIVEIFSFQSTDRSLTQSEDCGAKIRTFIKMTMKISIFNQTLTIGRYSASLFFLFPEDKFYYFPVYLVDNGEIPFDVNVRNAVVPDVV